MLITGMQGHTNEIFKDTGLTWISGYFLPEVFTNDPSNFIYVAQLALATGKKNEHAVITNSNLGAWLERDPEGQKTRKLVTEKGYHLKFQMVPDHPGWVYLNCFIPIPKE